MSQNQWRGIKTTQKRINERTPVTIINRIGQKSISLPRIDNTKRFAGFPGLTGWARKIAKIIPKHKIYVEPFAGAAKVFQELPEWKYKKAILNDKSTFVNKFLKQNFKNDAIITKLDFVTCVKKWDSKDTFFLFDKPWSKAFYLQSFSCFNRNTVTEYDNEILELCHNLKGKFIIASRKENKKMLKSGYKNKLIKSEYVLMDRYPKLLITTNLRLRS